MMGEVVGKCFLCGASVLKYERRVVEVREEEGPWERRLSCWRCWLYVMTPAESVLLVDGENKHVRPSSLLVNKDLGLVEEGGE